MKTIKKLLNHELLNIITLLNYSLLEPRKNQLEMQGLLKKLTLLIKHEEAILGEKPTFLLRPCSLNEVLDTISIVNEGKRKKNKVTIALPSDDLEIPLDRYYFEDALSQIHQTLLDRATQINYDIDTKNIKLLIKHDAEKLNINSKISLLSTLQKKSSNQKDIGFQLAITLLKHYGCKFKEGKGLLEIQIPKKK